MSTITRELAKLFRKITNSEIDAEGNAHVVLSPADSLLINNARIALASLEAKPIGAFHIAEQQVDGTSDYLKDGEWPIDNGIIEVYAAPPVPVVPEEKPMPNPLSMYAVDAVAAIAEVRGWNACRAAMLQGADGTLTNEGTMQLSGNSEQIEPVSNRDELPLDYLQGHKDGLEWAAQLAEANHPQTGDWLYDDPIDLARAIRKGPDMPTVQGGNSPVIPDGWVMVPEDPTHEMLEAGDEQFGTYDVYRRMIEAAPKLE